MAITAKGVVAIFASSATMAQQAGPGAYAPVELPEEADDTFIRVFNPARAPGDAAARRGVRWIPHVGRWLQP